MKFLHYRDVNHHERTHNAPLQLFTWNIREKKKATESRDKSGIITQYLNVNEEVLSTSVYTSRFSVLEFQTKTKIYFWICAQAMNLLILFFLVRYLFAFCGDI